MIELTNLEILETLSINHKKLKEDKPFLFHKILKAMDKAKSQAINYTRCCKSDSELLPKRLSNEAYNKAQVMTYDGFVQWWDEQQV